MQTTVARFVRRIFSLALFAWILLGNSSYRGFAIPCPAVHHSPPSDARKAFLAAEYPKAESLYRTALAAKPGDVESITGLVHVLLRQQKVKDAATAAKAALDASPSSGTLLTLRGEVELRQGEPWTAASTVSQSFKLDPCNPRTHLLMADVERLNSLFASAQAELVTAHQLDPDDPEIREKWIASLPLVKRIAEMESYLAEPRGDDAEDLHNFSQELARLKKMAVVPRKPCRLVSQITSTEMPLIYLMREGLKPEGFGLDVKFNGHSSRLQVDTGAGGLIVSGAVAKHAGLVAFTHNEVGGIGDEGKASGYTAFADSIRIGDLEFQNCSVQVVDRHDSMGGVDGLIGMNVFSNFLVTLDFPMQKLQLGPLPVRPGEAAAQQPTLQTEDLDLKDSENATPVSTPSEAASVSHPAPHGPYDRYIAPEMKDYTQVYRVGFDLIMPAQLNGSKIKLFIIDTGSWTTIISPEAASEVTNVYANTALRVRGLSGNVDKVYKSGQITFRFAHLSQTALGVVAFDTSKISKNLGMEISGFLGATTLQQLAIHMDYRDGLVKFDYDPKHGRRF